MDEHIERRQGGRRAGAGRPRNGFVDSMIQRSNKSRATVYLQLQRSIRMTPEALEYAADPAHTRKITGKALDIAGWFETAEQQLEVLKLAIDMRAARKPMSHARALSHLLACGLA